MKNVSAKLLTAGTIVVCAVALLFSTISITATKRMYLAVSTTYEHPYTVSNNAREMRSRLLDMKQFISIFLTDSFVSVEQTDDLLQTRYNLQQTSIDTITRHYSGPEADLDQLQEAMNQLIFVQGDTVQYAVDHTDEEIKSHIQEFLYPQYDQVSNCLTTILDFADSEIRKIEREAQQTATLTILSSVILSLIIVLLSIRSHIMQEKKRHQDVAYRETMFDLLSENVDDVFLIYNFRERKLEYISANCYRVLGFSEVQLRNLEALRPFLLEEDADGLAALFEENIIQHTPVELDFQFHKPGGELRWMNFRLYPVTSEGEIYRYIITISDQTNRIQAQQNLRDALAVAENADHAKKDFLSRMSHEIRTPMNAIIGMTTIAAARIDDRARVEDCLQKISGSSKHLLSLINDVLDMSKIEEGKLTIALEPFAFRQLMESVTSIAFVQARENGLSFEAALIDFTEEFLVGDSLRVSQILLNLLSNAVKFTPRGGSVRLEVRQLSEIKEQVRLRFTVSDTGIGMSPEFLSKLYLPFEQADGSAAQKYGGTGLGMSITRNLVTLLDGTIRVQSEPGKGTSFTIELPFGLDRESAAPVIRQELNSLKVLVVDDDQDTCVHASLLLEKMGIESKWVLSGAEAVELTFQAHESGQDYDVCFIDWKMPEMDGIETTRRIRQRVGPETLIIIISAYDWGSIEQTAREAGANYFISKPMFASSIYNTLIAATHKGEPAAQKERPHEQEQLFSGKRVLLAEDNELNMEIAKEILNMAGIEVDSVKNGQEAAQKVLASPEGTYDLVLMDVQMPVMNGYDATRTIRASNHPGAKSLVIYAMTANAFHEDVAAARDAGMDGHIAKPIDIQLLYQTLKEVFRRPAGEISR